MAAQCMLLVTDFWTNILENYHARTPWAKPERRESSGTEGTAFVLGLPFAAEVSNVKSVPKKRIYAPYPFSSNLS